MSLTFGVNATFCRIRVARVTHMNLYLQASRLQQSTFQHFCDNTENRNPEDVERKIEPSKKIEQILQNIKCEADGRRKSKKTPLNLAKPKFQRKEPIHQKRKVNINNDSEVSPDIISAVKEVAADLKDSSAEYDILQQLKSYSQETKEARSKGIEFRDILGGMNIETNVKSIKETNNDLKQQPSNEIRKSDGIQIAQESKIDSESSDSDSEIQKPDVQQNISDVFSGMKIDQREREHENEATNKIKKSMKLFKARREVVFDLFSGKPLNIFSGAAETEPDTIWNELNKHERRVYFTPPPNNPFEEMIQWTEKGQLWPFPIDNDYGVTEEANVGFHEHVFIQTELENGFPKKGPIRLFMELVCVGLSKNPYITVSRKKEHIDWFRRYFKEKEHLLEVKSDKI